MLKVEPPLIVMVIITIQKTLAGLKRLFGVQSAADTSVMADGGGQYTRPQRPDGPSGSPMLMGGTHVPVIGKAYSPLPSPGWA